MEISDLCDGNDRLNPAVTQDSMDHDPGHPKVWNQWFFSF